LGIVESKQLSTHAPGAVDETRIVAQVEQRATHARPTDEHGGWPEMTVAHVATHQRSVREE